MALDDSMLAYIQLYFYGNDTNEVKGSYHHDCIKKGKKIFCILNWGMAVSRVSETSEEKFFNV